MPAGRPSGYDPEKHPRFVSSLAELGATDHEIAKALGVSLRTLNNWKGKHPELLHSLNVGKHLPDQRVKRSLYQRAVGYSQIEDDIRTITLPNGGGSEIVITPVIKHYPPDTTACIFWLKNRMPEEFRTNPEESVKESVDRVIEVIRATRTV
jgi:DNA-binding XRE family transcriptional regulator